MLGKFKEIIITIWAIFVTKTFGALIISKSQMNKICPFFGTLKIHYEYSFYGASLGEKSIIVQ